MAESDQILLQRFAKGDEKAFKTFVERHFGLVLQVALRRTSQRQLAEEAAQNVFCAVAKKASSLSKKSDLLLPWLHRATLFESSKIMRSEQSSQRRKQLNHPDNIPSTSEQENTAWLLALPHLDEALDRLSSSDRKVVLQHYFEGQSFPTIAKQEGRPAGTVQKQCRRALDKLSRILRGRGATISALTLAGYLTPKLAQAASTQLTSTIATQAMAGASLHSTTHLSFFILMKSKYTLPLILGAVLLPLAGQQITIAKAARENRDLKNSLVSTAPTKTPLRSVASNRRSHRISTGAITLEAIQSSQFEAKRLGTLKHIEFEELIASLSQEDLLRLIPQALDLANQDHRRDLGQQLINALATLDPEATVHLVTNHNPEGPLLTGFGVERALSLWTAKDPETAIDWLRVQSDAVASLTSHDSRHAFQEYRVAALTPLIESRSPLVRDLLSLEPARSKYDMIRAAARFPSRAGWHTVTEASTVTEQAERVEAFLPWIREFGNHKRSGNANGNRGELLETVLGESSPFSNDSLPDLAAGILARRNLEATERNTVVQYVAKNILDKHFNSNSSLSWTEHQAKAHNWVNTHAPEQSETLLAEAQARTLKVERSQIERKLKIIEQQSEVSLARDFLKMDFQLFPGLLERAHQQAARISDPEERSKVEAHLSQ